METNTEKYLDKYSDAVVYRVAELFMGGGQTAEDVARQVNQELPHEFINLRPINRQTVYPLLNLAVKRHFLKLVVPARDKLAGELAVKYPHIKSQWIRVVETVDRRDNTKVARVAAELAMDLLREIIPMRHPNPVGLGLGPGRATLDFCQHFGQLLADEPQVAKIKLVAISAGGPAYSPGYASTSFFNLFPAHVVEKQVGLFAETMVPQEEFEDIQTRTGVKEAFDSKKDIDLVVTAMGDFHDEHDLLSMFLKESGGNLKRLRKEGWVGNVQYRPYSANGPIKERAQDFRAVTLFELDDLVKLADQKGKHVILIARQCGLCGRNRAAALRPLLSNPKLRVFSRLVVDASTAVDLLNEP